MTGADPSARPRPLSPQATSPQAPSPQPAAWRRAGGAWLVVGLLASCAGRPGAAPTPPICPETAVAASSPPIAPASSAPEAREPREVPGFELNKIPRKLALTPVQARGLGPSRYRMVPRGDGGVWLIPDSAARQQTIVLVSATGQVSEPWAAPVAMKLDAARDTGDGFWLLTTPQPRGIFSFAHITQLGRHAANGSPTLQEPFKAGRLHPIEVASDMAGNLYVLGTLVGPLASQRGTLTPPAGGRAEVLAKITPAGLLEWASALDQGIGEPSQLVVAADGAALVLSIPGLTRQAFTAFSPGGVPVWKQSPESASPDAPVPPQISSLAGGPRGRFFAAGELSDKAPFEFGRSALTGKGYFVARVDLTGRAEWASSFPAEVELTGDGAGSVLAVTTSNNKLVAHEIGPDEAIARAIEVDFPAECRDPAKIVRATATAALTATHLFVLVTCQPLEENPFDPMPKGPPSLFVASLPRKLRW